MNAWSPITFFEDENEAELVTQFVDLSAKHHNRFTDIEVARHVFKDLKDGDIRALQAAMVWGRNIDIQNRIAEKVTFNETNSDKDNLIKIAMAIATNERASHKDQIEALRLIAQLRGEIVKPIDKTITRKGEGGIPQIVFKQYVSPEQPDGI